MRQLPTIKKHITRAVNAIGLAVATVIACLAMTACDNDDDNNYSVFPINRPNALVTIKPAADGTTFYMQLDDSTRITATNMVAAPYGNREVRALTNFRMLAPTSDRHNYQVYINWIDSVLTKDMAADLGTEGNVAKYHDDPVEILRDWTVSEDGYLTIHFRTQWAPTGVPHFVNLVATNPANPYELTFFHNAQGVKGGYWGDGIVAFRLSQLPDTKGKTVDLTLHWQSFSGAKSVTFKYSTRKTTDKIQGLSFAQSAQFEKALK